MSLRFLVPITRRKLCSIEPSIFVWSVLLMGEVYIIHHYRKQRQSEAVGIKLDYPHLASKRNTAVDVIGILFYPTGIVAFPLRFSGGFGCCTTAGLRIFPTKLTTITPMRKRMTATIQATSGEIEISAE
jgi:hypothetical protein